MRQRAATHTKASKIEKKLSDNAISGPPNFDFYS